MKDWFNLFLLLLSFLCVFSLAETAQSQDTNLIARLQYEGGGDWYSDPTSLPNLLIELQKRLHIQTWDPSDSRPEEPVVKPSDSELFEYPLIYMTGHGTVRFHEKDIENLRTYFERGGTLWADDNYGMDESFRKEIGRVFPDTPLVEIPNDHPIYTIFYSFDQGLPKIHEHDGGPPELLGIFQEERLAVIYTYNTDIGDGIESEGVHPEDPPEVREEAMKMAINIVLMALTN